jgi:hypothetical protein
VLESDAAHVAHRGHAGRDDIVVRLLLLQHEPHGAHVILAWAQDDIVFAETGAPPLHFDQRQIDLAGVDRARLLPIGR